MTEPMTPKTQINPTNFNLKKTRSVFKKLKIRRQEE
jgi:hypothetical protein